MVDYYAQIKLLHIACVVLSGSLFALRGMLMLTASPYANHILVARLSYVIDTILLGSALTLTTIIRQYPFVQAWLTAKVLLLVVYIALGIFALRRGKTRPGRAGCFVAALLVYGFIISVAVMHDPLGCCRTPPGVPRSVS